MNPKMIVRLKHYDIKYTSLYFIDKKLHKAFPVKSSVTAYICYTSVNMSQTQ